VQVAEAHLAAAPTEAELLHSGPDMHWTHDAWLVASLDGLAAEVGVRSSFCVAGALSRALRSPRTLIIGRAAHCTPPKSFVDLLAAAQLLSASLTAALRIAVRMPSACSKTSAAAAAPSRAVIRQARAFHTLDYGSLA
jgi:hypothetical protein